MRTFYQRFILIIISLFLLNGCATKLAYNFLDWATLWYIESYVNLNTEQKKHTKNYLDEFHRWHRTTQLPHYALYLEGLQIRLGTNNMTGEMVHDETDTLQVFLDNSLNYLTPMFIELAATFTDKQVDELLKNLAKDRKKYSKDYINVDNEKLYKNRIDDLSDPLNMGGISGFNASQKALLRQWNESLMPFETLTLKQQEIWADELAQALDNRNDKPALEKTLRKLLFVHTDHWDEALEKRMDTNQDLTYDMLAQLLNSLTPAQRKKMNRKIDGYIQDFRELARQETSK